MLINSYLCVHFLINDVVVASTPMSVPHSLSSGNYVFSHTFRRSNQALPFRATQLLVESLGNHATSGVELMGSHVWNFNKHSGY